MKKPYDFRVMSDVQCKCGRKIKANVAERKENPVCYQCHAKAEHNRGHNIAQFGGPRKKRIAAGLPTK